MRLVLVFVAFTISLSNANPQRCQVYNDETTFFEIICGKFEEDCSFDVPSLDPSNELNLKIEGCDQNFTSVTLAQYPHISRLDLSDSKHQFLNFTNNEFPNLITFDASGNNLTEIPTTMLSQFPKLVKLRMNENQIEKISAGDFEKVGKELTELYLKKNKLKSIDDAAFESLTNLGEINLANNQLTSYPVALGAIRSVDLSENTLLTVVDCKFLSAAMKAEKVSLSWKYVTTFDGDCDNVKFVLKHGGYDQINNYANYSELICDISNQNKCFQNVKYFVAGPGSFQNENVLRLLGPSVEKLDLHGNQMFRIEDLNRKNFPHLKSLNIANTSLSSENVGKLLSEFNGADNIDAESSNKVWWILLSILGILVISFLLILCCLWVVPKLCKSD